MSTTLTKLFNASGDLDVMTTAEEYYAAYQAGTWLATNLTSSIPGAITVGTAVSPERSVGTFTNTFFNENVGTHPASSITSGTTDTTLKQTNPSYDPTALTNFRRPVTWDVVTGGLKELTDAEMNTVCDRLLAYIMVNEWHGANMRIATSTPADYTSLEGNFASDTQSGDGTVTNYTIYKKTGAVTAPTAARPIYLKRATYPSGTYQGVAEMTDTEIQETFGSWIATRMVAADDQVGRYLLTTSTPAGLGYSGTWQSRGTMTDTKDTTSEVDYSADYIGTYTRVSTGDFTGNFIGNYVGETDYTFTYQRTTTTNFSATYTRTNVTSSAQTTFHRTSVDFGAGQTILNAGTLNYARSGVVGYKRNPTQAGSPFGYMRGGNAYYARVPVAPTGLGYVNFTGNFAGNYEGNYTGDFLGDYLGNYINENVEFTRDITTIFTGDFTGNYAGNYTGNYIGTTIAAADTTVNTYTLYARVA